jgi:RimJ/RimL family protein N-acetyltransferase
LRLLSPDDAESMFALNADPSLAHGFCDLRLDRVIARAERGNAASIRVLAKCGLRFEKREIVFGKEHELWAASQAEWLG